MATEDQLIAGLKAADAAGNTDDAQHFADQIKSMRASPAPPQATAPAPNNSFDLGDIAKSAGTGLMRGFTGLADVANMTNPATLAVNAAMNHGNPLSAPTEQTLKGAGVPFHDPQTTLGKYAQTIGEFAPAAIGGPEGIGAKALSVVVPAIASEAAGQLTQGTKYEPYARTAGAMLGGGAAGLAERIPSLIRQPSAVEKANAYILQKLQSAGLDPTTAAPVMDTAAATGKPLTTAEVLGKPAEVGLGALARRDGSTADALAGQMAARSADQSNRVLGDYASASGIDPDAALGNMDQLIASGRVAASPLYKEAFSGGSTAPLMDQLRTELTKATGAKGQIAKQLQSIEQNSPGALAARGAAGADIRAKYMDLHDQLQQAEADRTSTLGMFKTAQSDKASNAPGAVWNPRVQQFLQDPIIKQGINKGLEIQRLESLAAGKPFNPTEYAVTGTDDAGNAIVGGVPNTRLLDSAKRGLDGILEGYRNPITQKLVLDDRGRAIESVRKSFLSELDNINPAYKAARASSADYLSANSAFKSGQDTILNSNATGKNVTDMLSRMNPTQTEAFKGGVANKLFNLTQNNRLNLKLFDAPIVQQKLTAALGAQNAQKFLDGMKAEKGMANFAAKRSPGAGSPTAEYKAEMDAQDGNPVMDAAMTHGGNIATHGFVGGIAKSLGGKAQDIAANYMTRGMPIEARNEAGRILMMSPQDFKSYLSQISQPGMVAKMNNPLLRYLGPAAAVPALTYQAQQ